MKAFLTPMIVALSLLLAGCASVPPAPEPAPAESQAASRGYVLGPGDKLRIVVFNETELSREYEVDGSGKVAMLLVGPLQAAGLSPREFETALAAKLRGLLRNPKVSVDVISYRPFYILGEVNKSGEYSYRNGMNVMSAIAAAGGFTYRANGRAVYIQRGNEPERSYEASTRTLIYPGDVIRVPERFF